MASTSPAVFNDRLQSRVLSNRAAMRAGAPNRLRVYIASHEAGASALNFDDDQPKPTETGDRKNLWIDRALRGLEVMQFRLLKQGFRPHTHDTLMLGVL